jgi:peptidoglycan/xylan/chitin deacetylase (PgdA/CDA1 family)
MWQLISLLLLTLASPAKAQTLPTVALTFDHYASTYDVAFPILKKCVVVGNFFVEPVQIGIGSPTSEQLHELQNAGWSIQVYSGPNLIHYLENPRRGGNQIVPNRETGQNACDRFRR